MIGVEVEIEAGERKVLNDEKELALDAGFVVPHTNSFGQTFRLYSFHNFCTTFKPAELNL